MVRVRRPAGGGSKEGPKNETEGRGGPTEVRAPSCVSARIDLPHFCVKTLARAHVCVCVCVRERCLAGGGLVVVEQLADGLVESGAEQRRLQSEREEREGERERGRGREGEKEREGEGVGEERESERRERPS